MRKYALILLFVLLGVWGVGCGAGDGGVSGVDVTLESTVASPTDASPTDAPTEPSPEATEPGPPLEDLDDPAPGEPASCVADPMDFPVESRIPDVTEDDHAHGPADASITIIEYADFQCPGCAAMASLRDFMEAKYGDDVRSVYRHFALSFHDKAPITGEAVEAAGAQGAFWEMHDLLYQRQQEWGQVSLDQMPDKMVEYAEELGLDTEQFAQDLADHVYLERVEADTQLAMEVGLPGTPTYIINGVIYPTQQLGLHPVRIGAFIELMRLQDRMYDSPPPQVISEDEDYRATIETVHGDIVIDLYDDLAPVNVNSFVFLAREGWYDGVLFHRVIPDFVAQAGDPTGSGLGSPGYRCEDEIVSGLAFDGPGVVGMASAGPGTGSIGSQFFITYDAAPRLDGNYTIIGRVVEGMDVARKLTPVEPDQGALGDEIETISVEER